MISKSVGWYSTGNFMIELFKGSGICGMLTLVTTFVLLVVGVILISQSKSRRTLVIIGLVALMPLIIGVLGTVAGYSKSARAREALGTSDQAIFERNREYARYTTCLGWGGTAVVWVIVGAAACLKGRNAEQNV